MEGKRAGQGLSLWGQAALHKCLLAGWGEVRRIQFLNWRLAGKWRSAPGQLGISCGDLWKEVKRRASFGQDHRDIVERRPMHLAGQRSADRLHLPKQPHCIGLGSAAPSGSPLPNRLKTELIRRQHNLSSQEGSRTHIIFGVGVGSVPQVQHPWEHPNGWEKGDRAEHHPRPWVQNLRRP